MKIFVDGHYLDGRFHGAAGFVAELYFEFAKSNPEVEIIVGCNEEFTSFYELFNLENVSSYNYSNNGIIRYLTEIPKAVARLRPDIVHTQYGLPLFRNRRTKYHVTVHDILFEDFPEYFSWKYRYSRKIFFRYSARRADILSTVSEYSRERIKCVYKLGSKNIYVLPNGIKRSAGVEISPEKDACNAVLYVSRFESRKNHARLIQVFKRLLADDPDLQLWLVGFDVDGTLEKIRELADDLAILENVRFLQALPDTTLQSIMVSARVVIYPSLCEGFGMPIIEALSVNKNTVFSNTTAMGDFTFAKHNMFDPSCEESIFEKVTEFLYAHDSKDEQWQFQSKLISTMFTWPLTAKTLMNVYRKYFLGTNK